MTKAKTMAWIITPNVLGTPPGLRKLGSPIPDQIELVRP